MEYKTISDIIDFVESYYVYNGNKNLTDKKEIAKFVEVLQTGVTAYIK